MTRRLAVLLSAALLASCGDPTSWLRDNSPLAYKPVGGSPPQTSPCPGCVVDRTFTRATGAPATETITFAGDPSADYVIDIDDNGSQGANASVALNGDSLVAPRSSAGSSRFHLTRNVVLGSSNRLDIRLTGKPGSQVSLKVREGARLIGPAGDSVRSADKHLLVSFPSGALAETSLVSISPSSAPFVFGDWEVVTGPYLVSVSESTLSVPATVRLTGPVGALLSPEVWTLEDTVWSFLPATALTDSSIEVNVRRFSTFSLVQSAALSQAQQGTVPLAAAFRSDGTYGIPYFDDGKPPAEPSWPNGWVADANVNLASGTINVTNAVTGCPGTSGMWVPSDCNMLRGAGGAISSFDRFGYGRFNARVRLDVTEGTRYSVYLYNSDTGANLYCGDEASIEIDRRNGAWVLHFTTYRRDTSVPRGDCSGTLRQTHNHTRPLPVWFNPAELNILTIDRQQTRIIVELNGGGIDTALAREGLPSGYMKMMLNAWAPGEFGAYSSNVSAIYEIESVFIEVAATRSALQLDGINDYAQVPSSTDFDVDGLTVEAWVRLSGNVTNQGRIVTRQLYGTGGWGLEVVEGAVANPVSTVRNELAFHTGDCTNYSNLRNNISLQVGVWYHVAGVYDGLHRTLYVNGVAVASDQAAFGLCKGLAIPIMIGKTIPSQSLFYWPGAIDEVRIWGVARSASAIAQNMRTRLTGSEANLLGYWRFDEGSGTTSVDATGRGNHATLLNGAGWTSQNW